MNAVTPLTTPRPRVPRAGAPPPAAAAAPSVFARLHAATARALRGVWAFLVAVGEIRAREQMRQLARQHEHTNPALAARLRAAARASWMD